VRFFSAVLSPKLVFTMNFSETSRLRNFEEEKEDIIGFVFFCWYAYVRVLRVQLLLRSSLLTEAFCDFFTVFLHSAVALVGF